MNFKEFLTEAGKEGQEMDFIQDIKDIYEKINKPFSIKTSSGVIKNVIDANKENRRMGGSEPITDVILTLSNKTQVNLSLKEPVAPSLAGGGLRGMKRLIDKEVTEFLNKAEKYYIKNGFKAGDINLPELSFELSKELSIILSKGNEEQGGPIDYFYIGPKLVTYQTTKNNVVTFNGIIYSIEDFVETHPLYLVLRRRVANAPFAPKEKDSQGLPKIFGPVERVSGKTGESKIEGMPRRLIIYGTPRGILI